MMADPIGRFWMVWNPQGRAPTYRHNSRAAADAEASRLSSANPGRVFVVLKAVGAMIARVGDPETIKIIASDEPKDVHTLRDR